MAARTTTTPTTEARTEPCYDIAHLAHVEILTPTLKDSVRFFVNVVGLTETERTGDSVYLRGWDDYEHHTLKLTAANKPGIAHYAFRTTSQPALERRIQALEANDVTYEWTDGDLGYGPAVRFQDPDGHDVELYYETEWYQPPADQKPSLKNQAQAFPARGANARRLDHLNLLANDIPAIRCFMQDVLGARLTEQVVFDDGSEKAVWFSVNNKSYDLAIAEDHSGANGRLHHVTYAVDSREDVLKAADICLDSGIEIETGPHKHAIQQTFFLYVFEPGGNRFEFCNAGARLILAPDWQTIVWSEEERKKGQAWGLPTIKSFHTYGTPPVD